MLQAHKLTWTPIRCTLKSRFNIDKNKYKLLRNAEILVDKYYPPDNVAKRKDICLIGTKLRYEHK